MCLLDYAIVEQCAKQQNEEASQLVSQDTALTGRPYMCNTKIYMDMEILSIGKDGRIAGTPWGSRKIALPSLL